MATRDRTRLDEVEAMCAEIYQVLGELGAPARVLDQLWAASQGEALPHDTVLPFSASECAALPSVAAAALGRRNKGVTSTKKAKAARLNGQKYGGRHAKFATGNRVRLTDRAPAVHRGQSGVIVRRGVERAQFLVRFDGEQKAVPVRTWWMEKE